MTISDKSVHGFLVFAWEGSKHGEMLVVWIGRTPWLHPIWVHCGCHERHIDADLEVNMMAQGWLGAGGGGWRGLHSGPEVRGGRGTICGRMGEGRRISTEWGGQGMVGGGCVATDSWVKSVGVWDSSEMWRRGIGSTTHSPILSRKIAKDKRMSRSVGFVSFQDQYDIYARFLLN